MTEEQWWLSFAGVSDAARGRGVGQEIVKTFVEQALPPHSTKVFLFRKSNLWKSLYDIYIITMKLDTYRRNIHEHLQLLSQKAKW